MKKYLVGFIVGVAAAMSIGAFAVNYAADILPLKNAILDVYERLEIVEKKLNIESSSRQPVGGNEKL